MHGFTTEEDRTPAKRADGPSPRSGVPDRGDRWIRNAGSWPRPRRRLLAFLTCAIARSGTPVSRHEAAPDPGVPELFPTTTSRAQGPHRAPNTTGRAQAHDPKGPPRIGGPAALPWPLTGRRRRRKRAQAQDLGPVIGEVLQGLLDDRP